MLDGIERPVKGPKAFAAESFSFAAQAQSNSREDLVDP